MREKCYRCDGPVSSETRLRCPNCNITVHTTCVDYEETEKGGNVWQCPNCGTQVTPEVMSREVLVFTLIAMLGGAIDGIFTFMHISFLISPFLLIMVWFKMNRVGKKYLLFYGGIMFFSGFLTITILHFPPVR